MNEFVTEVVRELSRHFDGLKKPITPRAKARQIAAKRLDLLRRLRGEGPEGCMPRTCTVCLNPKRAAIDAELIGNGPLRPMAARYGPSNRR